MITMEETMVENSRNTTDLENLPEPLIHHIMNFVPSNDAVKFSVLSRTLNSAWLSYPVLDFNYTLFTRQYKNPHHNFLSFIMETLHYRCPHRIKPLQRLRVKYSNDTTESFFHVVFELLLKIAIDNKAKEIIFDICTNNMVDVRSDTLLSLFSSQFLTVLKLKFFRFSSADYVILCPNLKELVMSSCKGARTISVSSPSVEKVKIRCCKGLLGVKIMGKNLLDFSFKAGFDNFYRCDINLSACESIKHMYLCGIKVSTKLMELVTDRLLIQDCHLPENLSIHNPRIKVLEINSNHELKNMFLSAPNLDRFVCNSSQKCSVDISACVSLKVLKLVRVTLTDECVRSTISDLSFLKELGISDCDTLERMELKNDKLEILSVKKCSNLKEVIVYAPKLLKLEYEGSPQVYPMQILSTKCRTARIRLPECKTDHDLWFGHLKQFLSSFNHFKNLTISCFQVKDMIIPVKFLKNNASLLLDAKRIKVNSFEFPKGQAVKRLVECLLRLVHKPLKFKFFLGGDRSTLKFEYGNKVVKRKRVEKRCCLGIPTKCWRHYALKVDIQGVNENEKSSLDKLFDPYTP